MCINDSIVEYSSSQLELSKVAKAIAHPARIAIVELLLVNSCTCNEIVRMLPLAQSTVSQHLKELKKAELIHSQNMPPKTIYHLNLPRYLSVQKLFSEFFTKS